MIVTCHTPECGNAEHAIDLGPIDPEFGPPDRVQCGVCGVEITDIKE